MDIDRLISIIHNLKEDGMVTGPTNAANSAGLGYDPNTETPPVFKKNGKYGKKYATGGRGSRRWWLQFLKGK
jgi:hypothetical protein